MAKTKNAHLYTGGFSGLLLGLMIPLAVLASQFFSNGSGNFSEFVSELAANRFIYFYMFLLTPLVFALFGLWLGFLNDKVDQQKRALENLNKILEMRQSALEKLNDTFERQAVTDPVTGLLNRRHLLTELEKEIDRAKRQNLAKPHLHAMMIDIDNFKSINGHYGHQAGDYVLSEAATVIKKSIRKIDIAGRYSGDEFIVILPETNEEHAKTAAERVRDNIENHFFIWNSERLQVTPSIGMASLKPSDPSMNLKLFMEHVDWALLSAKKEGTNRIFHRNAS